MAPLQAITTRVSSPLSTLSTVSPGGIGDAKLNQVAMDAPVVSTTTDRHRTAAGISQSPAWTSIFPLTGPYFTPIPALCRWRKETPVFKEVRSRMDTQA